MRSFLSLLERRFFLFFRLEINFQSTQTAQQLSQENFLLEKQQGSSDTPIYKD